MLAVSPLRAQAHSAPDTDDPSTYNVNNAVTVLPLHICYHNGCRSFYLATGVSDQAVAKSFGANYVPQLANVLKDTQNQASDNIYVVTNFTQFNVLPRPRIRWVQTTPIRVIPRLGRSLR
jgi:hypothetical protein